MPEQFAPNLSTVHVTNEVPSGSLDFSNLTFTLVNRPAAGSLYLCLNGVKMIPTTDYTISGKTITMVEAPHTDDILNCSYFF